MVVVRFNHASRRWPAVGALPLTLLVVWVALVGLFLFIKPAGSDATLCMFRNVTGVPCPTCGMSRAAIAAVQGRPLEALMFNPFMTIAAIGAIAWLTVRVGFRRRIEIDLGTRRTAGAWVAITVLFVANWVYVIQWHT